MKTLTAKGAKYGFGRLIDVARAEPVAVGHNSYAATRFAKGSLGALNGSRRPLAISGRRP